MRINKDKIEEHLKVIQAFQDANGVFRVKVSHTYILFTYRNARADLLVKVMHESNEEFEICVSFDTFKKLWNSLPGDEVELFNHTFAFSQQGANSEYGMDLALCEDFDFDELLKSLQAPAVRIVLSDFDQLKNALRFVGKDLLDYVALSGKRIVSSDRTTLFVAETEIDRGEGILIQSKVLSSVLKVVKGSINIACYSPTNGLKPFYHFTLHGVQVFAPIVSLDRYALNEQTLQQLAKDYEHENKAAVSKDRLAKALKRMSIVSRKNPYNRIVVNFKQDMLLIENQDRNPSKEYVPASVDAALLGSSFDLSCAALIQAIDSFSGQEIFLYAGTSPDATLVRIEDEIGAVKVVQVRSSVARNAPAQTRIS